MNVHLRPITRGECQRVREWRNTADVMPMLRTGYKTEAEQDRFYWQHCYWPWWRRMVQTPEHRYYAVAVEATCVGITGLTYLTSRIPGEAEISLVLGPMYRGVGIGTKAIDLVLAEAWKLGLDAVIGECYPFGNVKFWKKQVEARGAAFTLTRQNAKHSWTWRWERS